MFAPNFVGVMQEVTKVILYIALYIVILTMHKSVKFSFIATIVNGMQKPFSEFCSKSNIFFSLTFSMPDGFNGPDRYIKNYFSRKKKTENCVNM